MSHGPAPVARAESAQFSSAARRCENCSVAPPRKFLAIFAGGKKWSTIYTLGIKCKKVGVCGVKKKGESG